MSNSGLEPIGVDFFRDAGPFLFSPRKTRRDTDYGRPLARGTVVAIVTKSLASHRRAADGIALPHTPRF